MIVMNVPSEKMPRRTTFFCDGRRELRSIGNGVSMLEDLSVAAFFRFNVSSGVVSLHDDIKEDCNGRHACVKWNSNKTGPSSDLGVPLLCDLDRYLELHKTGQVGTDLPDCTD